MSKKIFTIDNFAVNLRVEVELARPAQDGQPALYRIRTTRYSAQFPAIVLVEGTEQKAIDTARALAYTKPSDKHTD